jgi:hypothetical protein
MVLSTNRIDIGAVFADDLWRRALRFQAIQHQQKPIHQDPSFVRQPGQAVALLLDADSVSSRDRNLRRDDLLRLLLDDALPPRRQRRELGAGHRHQPDLQLVQVDLWVQGFRGELHRGGIDASRSKQRCSACRCRGCRRCRSWGIGYRRPQDARRREQAQGADETGADQKRPSPVVK